MKQRHTRAQSTRWTRAFSLSELMVAVGILGIGMIMVAMAFPVALDQSRQAAELATSKLVYNEAVNTLKSRVKWTELETYINPDNGLGVLEYHVSPPDYPYYRLGADETPPLNPEKRIYLLSFGDVRTDISVIEDDYFFDNLDNTDCVYSADGTETYGWVTAVQKISNQTYKFWIFILREPKGIEGTDPQLSFVQNITNRNGRQLQFTTPLANFNLAKGEILLDDTGTLYTVQDVGEYDDDTGTINVMLDKDIQGTGPNYYFAHITGTGFTRKNPVITVYQTVISY